MKKTLYRSKNKKMCGVCAGLAEYIGLDVTIVRLAWVILTLMFMGAGILFYIACVFIIPEESEYIEASYREKKE